MASGSNNLVSFIDEALGKGEDQRESRSTEEAIDNALQNESAAYGIDYLISEIDEVSDFNGVTDVETELLKDRIERLTNEEHFYSVTIDIESLADSDGVIPDGEVAREYNKVHRMMENSTADIVYADDDWKTIGIVAALKRSEHITETIWTALK